MNRRSLAGLTTAGLLAHAALLHAQAAPTPSAAPTPAPAAAPAPASAPATSPAPLSAPASTPQVDATPRSIEIEGLSVQPHGLTADETARRALAASSSVRQKRAELDAANARIRQTMLQFVPRLGLRGSYTRISDVPFPPMFGGGFDTPEDSLALTAQLTIPLSDYILRLWDAAESAEASENAARFARDAEVRKVQTDARVLYYNYLRAHAQVSIARNALARTRARYEDAKAVFSVGRIANADLMRIEGHVATAELGVAQTESLRALIGAQLAIIMDDARGGQYAIGEGVPEVATTPAIEPAEGRRLIAAAMQSRLELKAVDAMHNGFRHGEDAVRAGAWPRLDAFGDFTYANPNQRFFPPSSEFNETWAVGLALSFHIDDPFTADARGDELAANADAVQGQRRGVEAAIVNEVVTAQLDIGKAQAALRAGEISVRAAEESYRVKTELFRVGRATPTDLIDAESELLGAKLSTANARIDLVIASQRLQYAVGADVGPKK